MKNDIYKLLTGKVRILSDSLMGPEEAQKFSDHVVNAIERVYQYTKDRPDWEDYATDTVWTMLNDWPVKVGKEYYEMFEKAALHIFSTNFPDAIEKLKTLQIYVEGRCPECGEPTRLTADGETMYDYTGGFIISEPITYEVCTLCNWNDL